MFVDGTAIARDGRVKEVNRREELANLITQSDYMDKAVVNRLWGHFQYGFTKPIDDLGPHNFSHPGLLEHLGSEFRKSSYNTKDLIS